MKFKNTVTITTTDLWQREARSPRQSTWKISTAWSSFSRNSRNADSFRTPAALSLTCDPLAESDSIQLLQITDVSQDGVRFGNQERTILEKTSHGKLLLRKAKAEIKLDVKGPMKVSACNMLGEKIGEVKAVFWNGILKFKADNAAFPGGTVAYHLTPVK